MDRAPFDSLANREPPSGTTLSRRHLLALSVAFAAGGLSYTVFASLGTPSWWAMTACALTTIGCRALAVMFDFKLPPMGHR